jgi:tRNA threonylcarbamoyl adenosine modification protein YjeE
VLKKLSKGLSGFLLESEADTELAAVAVSRAIDAGDSIGLSGDLGAGKTTFSRYLLSALGGDSSNVSSPTYTLQHEYRAKGALRVEHWDLYRVRETPLELCELPSACVIRIIEWPETCPSVVADLQLLLRFTIDTDGKRWVACSGARGQAVEQLLT